MGKILMGPKMVLRTMPVLLVGANVDDKPNFLPVAACGIANIEPPMISIAIRPGHYSYKGIRQNLAFSVNVPSVDMIRETDYCGIVSGSKINKAEVCRFKVFFGKLANAPLIEQCPINLECKVMHTLDLGSHSLFIGRIEETHIAESCLTDGIPDISKIRPLIYATEKTRQYRAIGEVIGKAFSIGEEVKVTE